MPTHRQVSKLVVLMLAGAIWIGLPAMVGVAQDPIPDPSTDTDQPAPSPGLRRSDVAAELAQINAETRELRTAALATRRAQQDRIKSLSSELQAKERTLGLVSKDLEKTRQLVEQRRAELIAIVERCEQRSRVFAELKAEVSRLLSDIEARIGAGVPWQHESRKNLLKLSKQSVDRKATTPAEALAILGRHQREEESLGRLVEVDNLSVLVPGEGAVAVKAVRIGLLCVIYSNPEGSIIGFSSPGKSLEDGLKLVRDNPEAAEGYLQAIEILNRERNAALIDLFFPSLPLEEDRK